MKKREKVKGMEWSMVRKSWAFSRNAYVQKQSECREVDGYRWE